MEERLDTRYLSPSPFERAAAAGLGALGVGIGILAAAWGLSFLWRYTPPEIAVRVANPELRVTQDEPLKVEQNGPFVLTQTQPLESEPARSTIENDQPQNDANTKSTGGDLLRREVTVFWSVTHAQGNVTTGWNYKDGSGGVPMTQYCYYAFLNIDGSTTKVDIASNGSPASQINASLIPDLQGALKKCQWWRAQMADLQ